MLKKTIEYTDYNGTERKEDFYFNLTQAEIMEIIATNDMKLANVPLKDVDLPDGVLIAAIHRGQQVIIPNGDTKILEDDKVTIFCLLSDIGELEKLFTARKAFL